MIGQPHDASMSHFRTDYCIFIQFKAVLTQEVRMTLVLLRTINARNIELHHDTRGETVGVLIREVNTDIYPGWDLSKETVLCELVSR